MTRLLQDPRMTSEPRPSDHLPQDAGPPASGDDLDQAFADVEQEVGIQPTPSGEPGQADADVFADLDIDDADDVFVIDDEELTGAPAAADAPAAEPVAAAAQQPAPQASDFGDELSVRPDDGASEPEEPEPSSLEDALFAPPKAIEPSERFGEEPTFREDGGHTWGGGDLSHEEIGIAAREGDDQSPHLLEEDDAPWVPPGEELEIVGDDGDRLDDDLDSGYPDAEADAAEQFGQPAHAGAELGIEPVEETDYTAPASGVWGGAESTLRPAAEADDFASAEDAYGDDQPAEEEDTYDPIYGAEATAAASEQDVEPEEPDYSEYEEAYVEHTAEAPVVVGAPGDVRRHHSLPPLRHRLDDAERVFVDRLQDVPAGDHRLAEDGLGRTHDSILALCRR